MTSIGKTQSNLVNSNSSGLAFLFLIISSLNYVEVDLTIYNSQNDYKKFFFLSIIRFERVKETAQGDLFNYAPKPKWYYSHLLK